MNGIRRGPLAGRLLLATAIALVAIAAAGSAPQAATSAAIPHWTGGIDLYRSGVFTTQKTWLWCTAADVQIIRNIADHAADHSRSSQERYFTAMRAHNRYDIPLRDGVDPAGWAYGLRHFVDGRYRLVATGSFNAALRSAVTNLRKTNLPIGITVARGNHAWILTGFTATADPAVTTRFTVTSVRVVGPLWGLQSTSYGYDMRPDTKLTPRQLAGFFTPWHYAGIRMAWEGDWVSIQPIGARAAPIATAAIGPAATSRPKPVATARPTGTPALTPAATAASGSPTPGAVAVAGGVGPAASGGADGGTTPIDAVASTEDSPRGWILFGAAVAVAALIAVGLASRDPRRRRSSAPGAPGRDGARSRGRTPRP
jgi:hypothetical protein